MSEIHQYFTEEGPETGCEGPANWSYFFFFKKSVANLFGRILFYAFRIDILLFEETYPDQTASTFVP
jgi:hypothetical protein